MIEPVQSLVTTFLENDGYFVQSNVRYATPSITPRGSTSAYGDLDIVAVKIDAATGTITDKLWGEVKAHLTSSLTPGYIRGFLKDYNVMLNLQTSEIDEEQREQFRLRQQQATDAVNERLGDSYRRVLFFGGRKPQDGGKGAKQLLHPDLEVVYISDLVHKNLSSITHREGNHPLFRVLNMLSAYGLLAKE